MKIFKRKKRPSINDLRQQLSNVMNPTNYMQESKEICTICEKEIIGIFENGGNMFSHTSYVWWIRDHHPIHFKLGTYHWKCFVETEEGKRFEQQCIESYEKDKIVMQEDSKMIF